MTSQDVYSLTYPTIPNGFLQGLVNTTPEEFHNAALFLRLGLPSTQIRHENGAFGKRSSNRRNLKTSALRFSVDGNQFENETLGKR